MFGLESTFPTYQPLLFLSFSLPLLLIIPSSNYLHFFPSLKKDNEPHNSPLWTLSDTWILIIISHFSLQHSRSCISFKKWLISSYCRIWDGQTSEERTVLENKVRNSSFLSQNGPQCICFLTDNFTAEQLIWAAKFKILQMKILCAYNARCQKSLSCLLTKGTWRQCA